MVDSMKQSFLLKPEVLTPNRNGFMAKKRKWHLKAESTVCVYMFEDQKNLNSTLAIDSPFQIFTVGLFVEFID